MEVSGQPQDPVALPLGKTPGTHWTGGWVGPRAGLEGVAKRYFLTTPLNIILDALQHTVST
jgi:hypothetical protein